MPLVLPTEKTPQTLTALNAKVLLYGPPKIGKTATAAAINPDETLFLGTEPGQGGQSLFLLSMGSWDDFRETCQLLATAKQKGELKFKTVVIDTADELFRMCQAATVAELGIKHPSDLEWGKGWQALSDKWRLGVGFLANLGLGVWFISHSKDEEIVQRVGKRTKTVPSVKGAAREFLIGFCDYILFATWDEDVRVVRTAAPADEFEAGGRYTLPDPIPLDGPALREAMEQAAKGAE